MAVKIDYRLDDAGWADCDVAIGSSSIIVEASYIGDALRDLVQAALAVVEGAPYAVARFLDEPGECRFVLEPQGDQVRVRILRFSETWSEEPDGAGAVRLDAMCALREFAEVVLTATRTILNTYGLQTYRERWRHEFPWDAAYKLDSALQRAASGIE
jgi:hypothetical protein